MNVRFALCLVLAALLAAPSFSQQRRRGPQRRGNVRAPVASKRPGDLRMADRLKPGDQAPDFTLKSFDGQREVTLSDFRGKKPVALVFGSYT